MRNQQAERQRARKVSHAIDQLLQDPQSVPEDLLADDSDLLLTVQRLAQVPSLLGPVDEQWAQRVLNRVQLAQPRPQRLVPQVRWAIAGVLAVVLALVFLSPTGQTAVAEFLAVFNLGRTEILVAPASSPTVALAREESSSPSVRTLTLEEAQSLVSFAIPQPGDMPVGYQLRAVHSYSFPDLPSWIPQPFFVELVYGHESGSRFMLRLYPIVLGEEASIARLNLQATPIQQVQEITINQHRGVLLRLGSDAAAGWQEIVWEQDDLILALSTDDLSESELLRTARSVR